MGGTETDMNRTAVVAGVGPGVGEAVARRLAAAGYGVGLLARSPDYVERLAADLDDAVAVTADVADADAVDGAVGTVRETLGPVDALVHNANAPGGDRLADASPASMEAVWRTRTLGCFNCLRALQEPEAVVVSGTNYAAEPAPGQIEWGSAATATKGLVRSAAADLGAAVTYVEIAAAVAPPDSDFAGAVGADRLADRYLELLDRDAGFAVERLDPA